MTEVAIRTDFIRLDQFLKLAEAVAGGGEAKVRVQAGDVQVNGEVETRRGRKLRPGDEVVLDGRPLRVSPGR
ncbi:MAG: RNA-binding S4 domain-containing protein [Deferrisomatales bacterium]|nr:RNA-binding S4 domain-containing protein [Deferrisomatales bacterium]